MDPASRVPFVDLSQSPEAVRELWSKAATDVINSGQYVGGRYVEHFEAQWANYCGAKYCIGVGNGLDALTISLLALGLPSGCLVAVPAHTFIATWIAVLQAGYVPVGVDVDEQGQLDLRQLERLDPAPAVVVPVHLHGFSGDLIGLMRWADSRGVLVIEDCAQSHGLRLEGRHVGTWGVAGAFSFYPTKNLGALGDGGAIVTDSEDVARAARSLRSYGSQEGNKYRHERLGVNSRLDPLQAAFLTVSLEHLDEWNSARRRVAAEYLRALGGSSKSSVQPMFRDLDSGVWHHFTVLSRNRQALLGVARSRGIGLEVHYPRLAAREIEEMLGGRQIPYLQAERLAHEIVSLPMHPWLSQARVERVAEFLQEFRDYPLPTDPSSML